MPTVGKVVKRAVRNRVTRDERFRVVTVRESTDYERAVDELLEIINIPVEHTDVEDNVEDKLLGLENWAQQVQQQAEQVLWAGKLELLGSNQVRRE